MEWNVGDRVQTDEVVDGKTVFHVGAVAEVNSTQVERQRYDYYTRKNTPYMETVIENIKVKWDDGEEETLGQYDVYAEDSEMERNFRAIATDAHRRIQEKLSLASKYLHEAVEISDETGVPFHTGISFLSQSYFPGNTQEKFEDLDSDFVNDITGAYHSEYGEEGWQHSAVC